MEYALKKATQSPHDCAASAAELHGLAQRIAIEDVRPQIDGGRFAAKRVIGDVFLVEADILTDGHGALAAALVYRRAGEQLWHEAPMRPLTNDRRAASC